MAIFDVPSLFIVGVGILREKNHFLLDKSLQSNIIGVKKIILYLFSLSVSYTLVTHEVSYFFLVF